MESCRRTLCVWLLYSNMMLWRISHDIKYNFLHFIVELAFQCMTIPSLTYALFAIMT